MTTIAALSILVVPIGVWLVLILYSSKLTWTQLHAGTIILVLISLSGIYWLIASEQNKRLAYERPAPVHTASEHLGLISGQSYPMEIGIRANHQTLDVSSRSFVFWTSSGASTEPGFTQRLGFTDNEGVSYIFEISDDIPITYRQTASASTITINLVDSEAVSEGGFFLGNQPAYGMVVREQDCNDCEWEYLPPDDLTPNALVDLVEEYVESVEITLNPDEFQNLLRP